MRKANGDFTLRIIQITRVSVVKDYDGRPKGFGYVEFETVDDLSAAVGKDGGVSVAYFYLGHILIFPCIPGADWPISSHRRCRCSGRSPASWWF